MNKPFKLWLTGHLKGARAHYAAICKLDDQALKTGDTSEYYEQAHQMFGYIAALEKCVKELKRSAKPKRRAKT